MNPLRQLISDGDGQLSTMRAINFIVVVPVMVVWTVLSIRQNTFIIPDAKIITLLATTIGGKALQSFSENFSPAALRPSQPQPTTPAIPANQ